MKYTLVALAALGLVSNVEAKVPNALALQIKSRISSNIAEDESSTSSSSSSSDEETLLQTREPCEYLDETQEELDYQVDMFSRTLDTRHWTNAVNIAQAINAKTGATPKLNVHTWELYDNAFSFPRVRRYEFVNENMDLLEHFEDNWNTNISNSVHMQNFLRVANTVRKNFNTKYHDGEFDDPGNHDPREEAATPKTWSQL
jgi:hypothetical protein